MKRALGPEDGVVMWLNYEELLSVPTSRYWNDETAERAKPFDIRDGDTKKLLRYLRESTTYWDEFHAVLSYASELGYEPRGVGVDVAAGVCWTTALLSRLPEIGRLYALDISQHRLLKIAPLVLKMLGRPEVDITRVLGSFYDIRIASGSVDFCFLSQAFHHADNPDRMLRELRRILHRGGAVLMIGESPIYAGALAVRRFKNVVKRLVPRRWSAPAIRKWWPSFADLYPPSPELGDHYYRNQDYIRIFGAQGFKLYSRKRGRYTVFVAIAEL